jgi:26S proteasome regulatory subunit N2
VGIIALLGEPQLKVNAHAINMLLEVVDFFWYEISDASTRIMSLAQQLPQPAPAWLLLSKLHFHLGSYEESVECALKAGQLFDVREMSPFVQTILAKAIDQYVEVRVHNEEHLDDVRIVEPALEELVERLIGGCLSAKEYKQAIGIAIEAHRLDTLETALKEAGPTVRDHLYYAQLAVMKHVSKLAYQRKVLTVIANIAANCTNPDFVFVADCLVAMHDAEGCARLLARLVSDSIGGATLLRPLVLQISFNICTDAPQGFLERIMNEVVEIGNSQSGDAKSFVDEVVSVLNGSRSTQLQLEFLYRNNNADMAIMEKTKECLNVHSSMHHSVLSCANAIMHCGSTNDEFLRKNLDWLGFATNWSKFTAASSLGVIHKGQASKGREILKPYLPSNDGSGSPYSEGGAMFALGLINARSGSAEKEYFVEQINKTDNEVLHHGLCLGLGASAMSSNDMELVDLVKGILYNDNAVSGEAAAMTIGLILHASGNVEVANEILLYAHETQHEKSIRGIAVAIALIFTGLREKADVFIDQLVSDKDPILRYGGMWLVATAYAGSSDNKALGLLLHAAVSDANDDVRRVAVLSLGFILCQNPTELPRLIELLTESYNPHVRYGAALALGIAFAGSGNKRAIELIKPMCKDFADYVRQGAYVALAMIMMQHNDVTCDQVSWARSTFETVTSTKHEDAMAKFGAVLAQGIIDAGGRNSVISLTSPSGHVNHMAVAGAVLFCQFWYWYPLTHFLSFALTPTALIAVDSQMNLPKLSGIVCNAKPSMFAPPPPIKTAAVAAPKKLVTAILSTAAKAAARAKKTGKAADMEIDVAPSPSLSGLMEVDSGKPSVDASPELTEQKAPEPAPESDHFSIDNLTRVTPQEMPLVSFPSDGKYALPGRWHGEIIVLTDLHPEMPAEFIERSDIKVMPASTEAGEPDAPEPFEHIES